MCWKTKRGVGRLVELEVLCRNQARVNAWRQLEGVLVGRKISRKLKGKFLDSYIVLDGMHGLETEALSEDQ